MRDCCAPGASRSLRSHLPLATLFRAPGAPDLNFCPKPKLFCKAQTLLQSPTLPVKFFRLEARNVFVLPNIRSSGSQIPVFSDGENVMRSLLLRSEEHTSELQSQSNLVCRLLLEKKTTNST